MKKIKLLLFGTLFIIGSVQSQETPKFMIGSGISFDKYSIEDDYSRNDLNFQFDTDLGYILSERWIVGLKMGFGYFNFESDYSDTSYTIEGKYISISPFVRFQNNITDKFKFYIEPNMGVEFLLGENYEYTVYSFGTNVGILYYATKNFSFELKILEFGFRQINYNDEEEIIDFGLKYNIVTPSIGLKYYF